MQGYDHIRQRGKNITISENKKAGVLMKKLKQVWLLLAVCLGLGLAFPVAKAWAGDGSGPQAAEDGWQAQGPQVLLRPAGYPLRSKYLPLPAAAAGVPAEYLVRPTSDGAISEPNAPSLVSNYTRQVFLNFNFDSSSWEICRKGPKYGEDAFCLTWSYADELLPRLGPRGERIVYQSNYGNDMELYSMDWDGKNIWRLTNNPGSYDGEAAWSPDGNRILFVSERQGIPEIFSMDPNGMNVRSVSFGKGWDFSPTWSSDGTQIAWVRVVSNDSGVVIVANADGSNPHVASPPLVYLDRLSWSDAGLIGFNYDSNWDGWYDVGYLNPNTQAISLALLGSVSDRDAIDYINGAFGAHGSGLIYTQITYYKWDGNWYITESEVTWNGAVLRHNYIDAYPDARLVDTRPPTATVSQLEPFTRADSFDIYWELVDQESDVRYHTLQYRQGTGDWIPAPDQTTYSWGNRQAGVSHFSLKPNGGLFAYRAWGWDDAENASPISPVGDVTTILYNWLLGGSVTDNRGRPLAEIPLAASPAPLDTAPASQPEGEYALHMINTGTYQLRPQASQAVYAQPLSSTVRLDGDRTFPLYLAPAKNALVDGGFESAQADWRFSGQAEKFVGGHSGQSAAALGSACENAFAGRLCLEGEEIVVPSSFLSFNDIAAGPDGTLHVIWWLDGTLQYRERSAAGIWSAPYRFPDDGVLYSWLENYARLVVDGAGTVHLVRTLPASVVYYHKLIGGGWSAGETIYTSSDAQFRPHVYDLALAPNGSLFLLFRGYQGHFYDAYLERTAAGVVKPEVVWEPSGFTLYAQAEAGADGNLQIITYIFSSYSYRIKYYKYSPEGARVESTEVGNSGYASIGADWDQAGRLFVVYNKNSNSTIVATRDPDGTWLQQQTFPFASNPLTLGVGPQGELYVLGEVYVAGSPHLFLYHKLEGQASFTATDIATIPPGTFYPMLEVSGNGRLHVVYSAEADATGITLVARSMPWGYQTADYRLSQAVSIPADIQHPTLSFMYHFNGSANWQASQASVQVVASPTLQATQVFTAGATTDWQFGWADLSAWAGQTVTVTFDLQQAEGEAGVFLNIDEVALAAWTTPVLEQVTPAAYPSNWTGQTLTLSGQNFVPGMVLWLGNNTLQTTFIDEHTLLATLPGSLLPGRYDMRLVHPDGRASVLFDALHLGVQLYLPVVKK